MILQIIDESKKANVNLKLTKNSISEDDLESLKSGLENIFKFTKFKMSDLVITVEKDKIN